MYKVFTVILIVAIPLFLALWYFDGGRGTLGGPFPSSTMPVITFNEKTPLRVTVVSSREDLTRGLSFRESLEPTEGMLFVFEESTYHGIWMKDMRFPIDILWLDEELRIVHLKENVHPNTFPKAFEPPVPARFVIETSPHFTTTFDIQLGDYVQIPKDLLPADLQK